jgi:hypothetical protein
MFIELPMCHAVKIIELSFLFAAASRRLFRAADAAISPFSLF